MRILLVEDNAMLRRSTSLLLSKWCKDSEVLTAEDGETAIEMLQAESFDLVFLDNELPNMQGHEVAREVQQTSLSKIPWLVGLSGHVSEHERNLFLKSGMNDAIQKPLSLKKFNEVIAKLQPL